MPVEMTLKWQGPYRLVSAELRHAFRPPEQAGLYLWTVGGRDYQYRLSYVGETRNISTRMYTHLTSMLGGAYYLYDDVHMTQGADPNNRERWVYQPGFQNLLDRFLSDYKRFSQEAFRNVTGYTFFWAMPAPPVNRELRQSIESALISSASSAQVPIQNVRPRVDHGRARRIQVFNILPRGVSIHGLPARCEYGSLE